MKRSPLPKTHDEFNRLLFDAQQAGVRATAEFYDLKIEKMVKDHKHQQGKARVEALKALTAFLNSAGQTMAELSRAMQSEADQL